MLGAWNNNYDIVKYTKTLEMKNKGNNTNYRKLLFGMEENVLVTSHLMAYAHVGYIKLKLISSWFHWYIIHGSNFNHLLKISMKTEKSATKIASKI